MKLIRRELSDQEKQAAKRLKILWETKKKELGLTQRTLAEKLSVTQSAVNAYLNANIPLNLDAVINFAAVLNVDPRDIYPTLPGLRVMQDTRVERRAVPVGGTIENGTDPGFVDRQYPRDFGNEYIECAIDDNNAYALKAETNALSPRIREGEVIVLSPYLQPKFGVDVVFKDKHEDLYRYATFISTQENYTILRDVFTREVIEIKEDNIETMHSVIYIANRYCLKSKHAS